MRVLHLLSAGFAFIAFLLFTGCSDYDGLEEANRRRLENLSELISGAGHLEILPDANSDVYTNELTRADSHIAITINTPWVSASGYYNQNTVRRQIYAFSHKVNNTPSPTDVNIWPGNLIQGISVDEPALAPVPVARYRKPGNIYLNVVSGQDDMEYSRRITDFSGSGVTGAMNDIMSGHTGGLPAHIMYSMHTVRSIDEMAYYLDMDGNEFDKHTNGTFVGIDWNRPDKMFIMLRLEQIYFTIGYDTTDIGEMFTGELRAEALAPYVYPGNPLCYISSVSYGRYFVLLYEVSSKALAFEGLLPKIFDPESEQSLTSADKALFSYANVRMVQVGGNADDGIAVLTSTDPAAVRDFVIDGATFSKDNIGAPIYYNLLYLDDNRSVIRYKGFDVTYTDYEYVVPDNNNTVEITVKSIFSDKAKYLWGNGTLSGSSYFETGPVYIYTMEPGGDYRLHGVVPNTAIGRTGTKSTSTSKSPMQTVSLGQLGNDTRKRIKIGFRVHYYTYRSWSNWFGSNGEGGNMWYDCGVILEFDIASRRWRIVSNLGEPEWIRNTAFRSIGVSDAFNCFEVNFRLDYEFKANSIKY